MRMQESRQKTEEKKNKKKWIKKISKKDYSKRFYCLDSNVELCRQILIQRYINVDTYLLYMGEQLIYCKEAI